MSHCDAYSRRDEVAEELQQFIDVDIYGKCGNMECDRSSSNCDAMLNTTYSFYLAFENALCVDYLTEKLYNAIQNYVIPIVYSGADMSRFLPPKSYINVEDYETVEDLAKYLKFLTKNPNEYIKYFWWRRYYKITRPQDIEFCAICRKLNEPNFNQKQQTYRDMKEWLYRDVCRSARISFQ